MITFVLAVIAWAVIPFAEGWVISDLNVGILYLFAISSLGVYGVIMGGWAANSKYPFLGGLRSAAQMVSYEVSIGFVIVTVLLMVGSLNLTDIVLAQSSDWGLVGWYFWKQDGVLWFVLKIVFFFFLFSMVKAIVPRYRYDQLMRIGWKVFLPLSLAFVVITAGVMKGFDIAPWTMTEEAHEIGRGVGLRAFGVSTRCVGIRMGKSVASPANFARRSVPHRPSTSTPNHAKTDHAARRATTLI